jgi:hypothetical protein
VGEVKHQELIFGVASQTLVFDAPEGRPTAEPISVTVYAADADDTSQAEIATTGSASVETNPNTTVDVASGIGQADRTELKLAATTGATRGRQYMVVSTTGERETAEIKDVTAGDAVRLRHPLRNAYEIGSTFFTTRVSIAVLDSWAADQNNITSWIDGNPGYRVRWVYVVDGITRAHASFFSLLRYTQQYFVSPADVDRDYPGWLDRVAVDYQEDQGASLIDAAYHAVRMDARGDALLLAAVRDTEVLAELVKARSMLREVEYRILNGAASGEQLDTAQRIYTQRYNQLVREPHVQVDRNGGGAAAQARRHPLWRR